MIAFIIEIQKSKFANVLFHEFYQVAKLNSVNIFILQGMF